MLHREPASAAVAEVQQGRNVVMMVGLGQRSRWEAGGTGGLHVGWGIGSNTCGEAMLTTRECAALRGDDVEWMPHRRQSARVSCVCGNQAMYTIGPFIIAKMCHNMGDV